MNRELSALRRRFRQDRRGVAAIEFAMVLPVILLAYVGMINIAQMVMVDRKVAQLTLALSDLTSRLQSVPLSEVGNIFNAAGTILLPYDAGKAKMMIASVVIDANRDARICWINTSDGSKNLVRGDKVTLPDSIRIANTSVIMAQASYAFTPLIGDAIFKFFGGTETNGDVTLGGNPIYTRPRKGLADGNAKIEQIVRTDVKGCPAYT